MRIVLHVTAVFGNLFIALVCFSAAFKVESVAAAHVLPAITALCAFNMYTHICAVEDLP